MNETKFTKGPWTNSGEGHYIVARNSDGELVRHNSIAKVFPDDQHSPDEETRANAKLIAAAPELYKALKRLKYHTEILTRKAQMTPQFQHGIEDALAEAFSALTKATQ